VNVSHLEFHVLQLQVILAGHKSASHGGAGNVPSGLVCTQSTNLQVSRQAAASVALLSSEVLLRPAASSGLLLLVERDSPPPALSKDVTAAKVFRPLQTALRSQPTKRQRRSARTSKQPKDGGTTAKLGVPGSEDAACRRQLAGCRCQT
jgi:hypothetical protein